MRFAPASGEHFRWSEETRGLYTALLESGLADLPGVVPLVTAAVPAPALLSWVPAIDGTPADDGRRPVSRWTADASVLRSGLDVEFRLELCDESGSCVDYRSAATREDAWQAVAAVLRGASTTLGRAPSDSAAAAWDAPQSGDPYAVLLCGRSAAVLYGILPPVEPELIGDKRRDPVARAVFLDPSMPIAQWVAGRRELLSGDVEDARQSFARAALNRPDSALFRADEADALAAEGKVEAAALTWDAIAERGGSDPRLAVPRARLALRAGESSRAGHALDGLEAPLQEDPAVLSLRVAIADAAGPPGAPDELLQRWQSADERNPEPVRRRLSLWVREGRYQDALLIADELAARGAQDEAAHMALALAVAIHDWDRAVVSARKLEMEDTALRLRARAALEKDPAADPGELRGQTDAVALVVRGGSFQAAARPLQALALADRALAGDPWMPEALALRADALDRLGRTGAADEARARLRFADPAWASRPPVPAGQGPGDPSTAPGSTATGSQAQAPSGEP